MSLSRCLLPVLLALTTASQASGGSVEVVPDILPSFSDEALHEPKYNISLRLDGVIALSDAEAAEHRALRLTGADGTRYVCHIPTLVTPAAAAAADKVAPEDAEPVPSQLLERLEAHCFYRFEDWWTYEFCFKKSVRQFHKEGDAVTADFSLGAYEAPGGEEGGGGVDEDEVRADAAAPGLAAHYVRQAYTDGDECELTGGVRQTEVRFSCGDGSDAFLGVREAATCQYVITFATPALCGVAALRAAEPPAHPIRCGLEHAPKEDSPAGDQGGLPGEERASSQAGGASEARVGGGSGALHGAEPGQAAQEKEQTGEGEAGLSSPGAEATDDSEDLFENYDDFDYDELSLGDGGELGGHGRGGGGAGQAGGGAPDALQT